MGVVIKQSIRSSLISYIGVVIGYINVLWLYPYFLSTEQIGLFRLIQSASYLLATFGQIGLGQGLVKFYPELKEKKGFLTFILLGGLCGSVILFILAFIFQQPITNYFSQESALFVEFFSITLIITSFLIFFQIAEAYCRSLLNIILPTFLRDINLRALTTIALLLYGFGYVGFNELIYSLLFIYGANSLIILVFLFKSQSLSLKIEKSLFSKNIIYRLLKYSFFSLLGAGGTQIILQIDSIMVSGMIGLEATGIYTIAFFIGIVIEMPKRAITQISSALLSQSFNHNKLDEVKKLYRQTSINQAIIGSLLLIGVWANLENIYSFIPNGESFSTGMAVVLFIGLGKLSDMIFGTNGEIIVMSKYYKFNVLAILILSLLTIVLNTYLIPTMGIEGAALASFLAMLTFNLVKMVFIWVKFGFQPFTIKSAIFVIICTLTIWVSSILPKVDHTLLDIIYRSSIITIVLLGSVYLFKISEELNSLILNTLKKIGLKRI